MKEKLTQQFEQIYSSMPEFIVQSPGRVNLIGEHTDYNDGFVLPMAVNRYIWLCIKPRNDSQVNIYSVNFKQQQSFNLDNLREKAGNNWIEYAKGMAWILQKNFTDLKGFDGLLYGNIPRAAGLSSSAALELTIAKAFAQTSNIQWHAAGMAKLAQQAENQWIGVNCGIMDQMIIAAAKENHALLIDCRSLATKYVPIPNGIAVVIMDTATRRGLVDSAYNERRQECEYAAKIMGATTLREVSEEAWNKSQNLLAGHYLTRARHVITENRRVLESAKVLQAQNPIKLGELMNASHKSLKDDFEVSSENLNIMVNCARETTGCFGARMTGAGFGGCAVAIVKEEPATKFAQTVAKRYEQITRLKPYLYVTNAARGAGIQFI